MKLSIRNILSRLAATAVLISAAGAFQSCHSLYDDLQPCPQGARLRFVYTYNMEFANAFPSQVDCLTLLVYDEGGEFVGSFTETSGVLADENWRLTLPLEPGKYSLIAWGGLACDEASFHFSGDPASSPMELLKVELDNKCMTAPAGSRLHPLFFGKLDIEIPTGSTDYTDATVEMMKDTNNVRILLQNIDGTPADGDDFIFTITDDNTLLNYDNSVATGNQYTYYPWTSGQASAGVLDNGSEALLAFAEISTSRLMAASGASLAISRKSDMKTVLEIPLVNFLLLLKSQEFSYMGSQEFLDRESRWNMVFFLDSSGGWIDTYIKINDWIVRINNAEM